MFHDARNRLGEQRSPGEVSGSVTADPQLRARKGLRSDIGLGTIGGRGCARRVWAELRGSFVVPVLLISISW